MSANKQTLISQSTQQCEACGTFGHGKAHQCWALPKHILMARWAQKNPRKADEITKAHLLKNSPENRARVSRKMVRANMVDADKEYEYMFSEDVDEFIANITFTLPDSDEQE